MVLRLGTVLFLATLISSLKKRIKIERTEQLKLPREPLGGSVPAR